MRRVIVNSTPLIVLSHIGKLDLLRQLYGEIVIPQAVYDEVTQKKDIARTALESSMSWIKVISIKDTDKYTMYKAKLHAGEVETMILAQEEPKADLVIIDDNTAKKTAKFLGLSVTGTIGILLKSKRSGYIDAVAPLFEKMRANGFYVSEKVMNLALEKAQEKIDR